MFPTDDNIEKRDPPIEGIVLHIPFIKSDINEKQSIMIDDIVGVFSFIYSKTDERFPNLSKLKF